MPPHFSDALWSSAAQSTCRLPRSANESKIPRFWPDRPALSEEAKMPRQYIDCREFPSEMKCTVAISADNTEELVNAAVQHAVSVHGEHDTAAFRAEIRKAIHQMEPSRNVA
jgi:predicted small metal-binding protein